MMRVLDLFSGVGMMGYGLEAAGHEVVAFCEIEEFPRRVLRKHWPDVPIFEDVRELNYERLKEAGVIADPESLRLERNGQEYESHEAGGFQEKPVGGGGVSGVRSGVRKPQSGVLGSASRKDAKFMADTDSKPKGRKPALDKDTGRPAVFRAKPCGDGCFGIDIITGGFPCQDLSVAGKQAGITGSRSGLFDEIIRLACELRPRYILLENVAALLTGSNGEWAGYVFGRLADIGYDCEWHVIPAGGFETLSAGAPHRRDRVWIVAHARHDESSGWKEPAPDHEGCGRERQQARCEPAPCSGEPGDVAHSQCEGRIRSSGGGEGRSEPGRQHSETQRSASPEGVHRGSSGAGSGFPEPRLGNSPDGPAAGLVGHRIAATLADIPVCDSCGEIHNLPTMGHTGACWMCWGNGSWEQGIPRITTQKKQRPAKLKALGNGLMWQIPWAIGKTLS